MHRAPELEVNNFPAADADNSATRRFQRLLMRWHRRYGTAVVVIITTVVSIALSLIFTAFGLQFVARAGNLTHERFVTSMLIGLMVPLVTAPVASLFLLGLLSELDRANNLLRIQARTDALTNVLNRRGFFEQTQPILTTQHRVGVLLCMVDVDRFKQLNDEFGHDVGDRALVTLAERMTAVAGPQGVVARLGGDEFALVVPGHRDTDDFRSTLAATFGSVPIGDGVNVTASFGVTSLKQGDTLDSALTRADVDLYQTKARSRSQSQPSGQPAEVWLPDTSQAAAHQQVAAHRPRHRREDPVLE